MGRRLMRSGSIQRAGPPVYPKIGPGWGRPSVPTCEEKGAKGWRIIGVPTLEDSVPSPGQQNTNKTNKKDIPTTRGLQVPQKGAGEKE